MKHLFLNCSLVIAMIVMTVIASPIVIADQTHSSRERRQTLNNFDLYDINFANAVTTTNGTEADDSVDLNDNSIDDIDTNASNSTDSGFSIVNYTVHHTNHDENRNQGDEEEKEAQEPPELPNSKSTNAQNSNTTSTTIAPINHSEAPWQYWGPRGEHHWEKSYRSCRGRSQSPINIKTSRVVYLSDLVLTLINFDRPLSHLRMTNNGHTVKVEPTRSEQVRCFVGGSALFGSTYRFVQLHFHWRNAHSAGSEHAIDGVKYSMELHLVFQNVKYDKETDTGVVMRQSDAFTVMAVFFEETTDHNPALEPVVDHLWQVEQVHSSMKLPPSNTSLRLDSLLPPDFGTRFYRYAGSYTTPGCQEVVTWLVFPDPLPISPLQMRQYQELISHVARPSGSGIGRAIGLEHSSSWTYHLNKQFIGFFRHIQELGSRRIYAPEEMAPSDGAVGKFAGPNKGSFATLVLAAVLLVVWCF